jgi:hypothetical protein
MPMRWAPSLARACAVAIIAAAIAGCTPGGQFDPTTLMSNDVFDSKKPLKGTREPVFPNGVPGIETGVPPDLVKGYQPPPEQADNADASAVPPTRAAEKPKLRPSLRPVVARAPAPRHQPSAAPPTRISVGPPEKPAAPQQESTVQSMWPTPEPAPQQTAPPPQATGASSMWPAPPSAAPAQTSTRAAQPSQQSQSMWPSPPTAPPASQ